MNEIIGSVTMIGRKLNIDGKEVAGIFIKCDDKTLCDISPFEILGKKFKLIAVQETK